MTNKQTCDTEAVSVAKQEVQDKLKLSELSYRRLFETAQDGILLVDSDTGMILDVNPYLINLLKYNKKQFLNKYLWEVGCFHNILQSKKQFKQLQKAKFIRYENLPLETKGGNHIEVEFVANEYSVGHSTIIQCNIRNISDRRLLEKQAEENRYNLEVAHSIAKIGTYVLDVQLGVWTSSKMLDKIFGLSNGYKRTVSGWIKLIYKDDRVRMKDYFQKNILTKHQLFDSIYRIERRTDGSIRWVHGLGRLEINEQNKPIKMIGTIQDITEKKTTEDLLKESEEKYHTIVEKSNDGIIIISSGQVEFVNSKLAKMLGYSPEEAIGRKFIDFVGPSFRTLVADRHKLRLQGKKAEERYEFSLITKDAVEIPVEVNVSLVSLKNKLGSIAIVRDMTKAKELEKMKSEFISVVSHQMRTPLTGVKWFTELLLAKKAGALSELQTDYVTQVHNSNLRMIKLVNDLLDVSHLENLEKFKIHKKSIDVIKMFHEIIESQRPIADKNNIKIVHQKDCLKSFVVKVDKEKLSTVLQNVLDNAIKYSRANGIIEFTTSKKHGHVVFMIKDHGVGIPAEQHGRVFERFFRADNVISTQSGTGLGLFIAKQIIEKHGGKIWFESKESEGTIFHISIPINNL